MKYPVGIQNFEKIRTDGYVYVDKTAYIYRLVDTGSYYFLSRPRRFGKSLLISTMEAYFSGRRDLFKGLAIDKLDNEWLEYPVLHLDLNTGKYETYDALVERLDMSLSQWEAAYGKDETKRSLALRFEAVVRRACEKTGRRVVILVDEYDKPMLQAIENPELQEQYRNELKAFYSVLKSQDRYIKFAFLTGVTKFGKVSVFSDLNNLDDISMNETYADICGISEEDIHAYFEDSIAELASASKLSYDETLAALKEQYDGYHFEVGTPGIYNPFSLLNTFKHLKFRDYWFETGTPSYLVYLLQNANYNLNALQGGQVSGDVLNSIDSLSKDPIPVIYQSGYLTIKDYDERFRMYRLGFPNKEVEIGFTKYLMPFYTTVPANATESLVSQFVAGVESGNPDDFLSRLQMMFDDADYRVAGDKELYFQNSLYIVFKLMGFYTEVEHSTSRGRIDVLIKTKDYIYIIECKLDGSAASALQQIEDRGYARPFAGDSRKLFKIGVSFSGETRSISDWKIVE